MRQIQQLTSYPLQKQTISLPDGTSFTFNIYFITRQTGWFIQELTYGDFTLKGMRVVSSPNILRQWRNQIPFGIACLTDQNRDPLLQQDFLSGASKLFLLSKEEVDLYEEFLERGV